MDVEIDRNEFYEQLFFYTQFFSWFHLSENDAVLMKTSLGQCYPLDGVYNRYRGLKSGMFPCSGCSDILSTHTLSYFPPES
jgi:hypothetical protein